MGSNDLMNVLRSRFSAQVDREIQNHIGALEKEVKRLSEKDMASDVVVAWFEEKISAMAQRVGILERQVKNLSAALETTDEDRESARILTGNPIKIIAEKVARITSIPADTILSDCRIKEVAEARQLVMHMASKAGYSRGFIARALKMDYSTVTHAIRREAERRAARAEKEAAAGEVRHG